jgi:hypothetical protein
MGGEGIAPLTVTTEVGARRAIGPDQNAEQSQNLVVWRVSLLVAALDSAFVVDRNSPAACYARWSARGDCGGRGVLAVSLKERERRGHRSLGTVRYSVE